MFERALIRTINDLEIDIGMIAETIFFYGKTHLLLNRGSLVTLAKALSVSEFEQLLESGTVELSYTKNLLGIQGLRTHRFIEFFFSNKNNEIGSAFDEIEYEINREFATSAKAVALKKIFLRNIKEDTSAIGDVSRLTDEDVSDPSYPVEAVRAILGRLVPDYSLPSDYHFSVHETSEGFIVDTNLDYTKINDLYHQRVPVAHGSISTAHLLGYLQGARAETYFAAHYSAEIVTTPILSDLVRLKHFEFLRSGAKNNKNQIELFKEVAVGDFPTIREVINSGERTFPEFLKLVRDAERFRTWLHSQNLDANLLREYLAASTASTWADKLPTKGVRFALATGLGIAGEAFMPTGVSTIAGLAVGASDTFLLDKIIKGWRPNQFIEGRMRSFVAGSETTSAGD